MRRLENINYGRPGMPIHAYITREYRERLAPFSLFDHFHGRVPHDQAGGIHPHSGIAAVTYMLRGGLTHFDTNGRTGLITEGGLQWMSAGKGIWHDGAFQVGDTGGMARDLQLWIQLPPELELGDDYAHDIASAADIPLAGNTRVLLGEYQGLRGAARHPLDIIYLRVSLRAGESWSFAPPEQHRRGFIYPFEGAGLSVGAASLPAKAMGILEDSSDSIHVEAVHGASDFIIALAEPSPCPVFAERGSVHTSMENLREGRRVIAALGRELNKGVRRGA